MVGDVCDGNELAFTNPHVCVETQTHAGIISEATLMEQVLRRHVPKDGTIWEFNRRTKTAPSLGITALVHNRKWVGFASEDGDEPVQVTETLEFVKEQHEVEYEDAKKYDYAPMDDHQFCIYAGHCKFFDAPEVSSKIFEDFSYYPAHVDARDKENVFVGKTTLQNVEGDGLFAQTDIPADGFVCAFFGQFFAAPYYKKKAGLWTWTLGSPAMQKHLVYQTLEGCFANKINAAAVCF
jgi:hypothetical protein